MKKKSHLQYDIVTIMNNNAKKCKNDNNTNSVSHNDILAYLSHFKNIDDLLEYNCPQHLELSFNDSVKHSDKKHTIPTYKEPSQIYISTMTTVCYLRLKYRLNLSALFNMLPCYAPELCFPNKDEISILNLPKSTGGAKRPRKKIYEIESNGLKRLKQFTTAFMKSGWILCYKNAYCPLKLYYKQFCEYYEERCKTVGTITENIKTPSYDEWRNEIENILEIIKSQCSEFKNINIKKVYRNVRYPQEQSLYSNAILTKTEFYNPELYPEGSEFIFGCDVRNIFPTIIDNKYKGMVKGDQTVSAKKKATKKAFDNQCTMRIANDTLESKINTKMFVNGKLQMTGCKSIKGTEKTIRYLIHELEILSHYMENFNKVMRELKLRNIGEEQIKSSNEATTNILDMPSEIIERIMDYISAMELLNFMTISKWFYQIINNDIYWVRRIKNEFKFKIKYNDEGELCAYEKYNPRYKEYRKLKDLEIIKRPIEFYVICSDERYIRPYVPLRPQIIKDSIGISDIKTEMINSNFDVYFYIDQTNLTKILQSEPYNLFVTFDTHPGVNIKHVIKDGEGKENEITILVFRTGKIIITGVKSYDLLHQSYNFINSVLKKHYYEIWQPPDSNPSSIEIEDLCDEVM